MAGIDSQFRTGSCDTLTVDIVTKGRQHPYINTQQAHIVGNIASHTAKADLHCTGIGISGHQRRIGSAADVHIHTADHHRIIAGAQHIATSRNMALAHQIGDVHRHRGSGNSQLICQFLLGNHRVGLNQLQNLPFSLRHIAIPLSFNHMFII